MRRMKTAVGPLGILSAVLLCLPCLLPLIAVLGGVAILSAMGGFITANAFVVGLGAGGAIASLATAAYVVRTRARRGSACESPDAQATLAIEARRQQP